MKYFVCLIWLFMGFSALSQETFTYTTDSPLISPNSEWIMFKTFDGTKELHEQKIYLMNQKGEKINVLVGCDVLGFKSDSKSIMVVQLYNSEKESLPKIKELSLPDFKLLSEKGFGEKMYMMNGSSVVYLPQKNRLLISVPNASSVYIESWDWNTKKLVNTNRTKSYVKDLEGFLSYDVNIDETKILFTFQYPSQKVDKRYPSVVDVETLELVTTLDLKDITKMSGDMEMGRNSRISANGTLVCMFEEANMGNYDAENQTYNPTIYFWDANTGQLIKKERLKIASIVDLFIDSNEQIVATGFFNKMQVGSYEAARKIDYKSGEIISTYRSANYGSVGRIQHRSTILWLDQVKFILTPFDLKTWSKGNPIKLWD
jgi:hypothetical protein